MEPEETEIEEVGSTSRLSSPEELPKVASVESIPSVPSMPVVMTSKMRKPSSKLEKMDVGSKDERVVVPLGETLGNIPVPRRVRR